MLRDAEDSIERLTPRARRYDPRPDEGGTMVFQVGDRVVAESESTERAPRAGTVREVLRDAPARYRIEWDDGHESIYAPAAGALSAELARGAAN